MIAATLSTFRHARRLAFFAGPAVIDQAIISGLNFAVAIYLARTLGMTAFGQFSLILIITFFCLELQRALIVSPMMTFAARKNTAAYFHDVFRIQWVVVLLLGAGAAAFIYASGILFPKWDVGAFAISGSYFILFRLIQEFLRRFLFIRDKAGIALIMDTFMAVLIIAGLIFLHLNDLLTVQNVLWVHTISYALAGGLGRLRTGHLYETAESHTPYNTIRKHWIFGRWLLAAVIVTYASSNFYILSGGAILGSEATGIVKTAQYVMGGMIVLFQAMDNILPFRMAEMAQEGTHAELQMLFLKTMAGMVGAGVLHGIFIYVLMKPIVFWLGISHVTDIDTIIIANIAMSLVLSVIYGMQYLLRALEHTQPVFWANLATSLLSIATAPFVVRTYGVLGIVYGLISLQIIAMLIYSFFLYRYFWRQPT